MSEGESLGMNMGMTIYFSEDVTYVFKQLKIKDGEHFAFGLSLLGVFCFCFFVQAFLALMDAIKAREKRELHHSNKRISTGKFLLILLGNFILFMCSVTGMMLLMTCNGYVILTMVAGNGIGYALFIRGKLNRSSHFASS